MNRSKKYTHLIARCSRTAKRISATQLKKYCGYTLSDAYWRMEEGKGLITLYDQKSFELWSDIMNNVARIKPLSSLTTEAYKEFCKLRSNVWKKMESYREWLENGSEPLYVSNLTCGNKILDPIFFYRAVENTFGEKAEIRFDDNHLNILKTKADKLAGEFEAEQKKRAEAGMPIQSPFIPYDAVYQIRTDYTHKTSVSDIIRGRLDGIWSISDKSSTVDREVYRHNAAVIEEYLEIEKSWKDKKKTSNNHLSDDGEFWMEFLRRIRIPEFKIEED